jgi:hypothetical protein
MRATHQRPNQPAAGKAGIARRLTIEHHRPGLPEPDRSASKMSIVHSLASLLLLILLLPINARARFVQSLDMKTLMKRSQLVCVGHVKSVAPSGITTELTYPTWEGVVFEWLKVEVEVIEPIKGAKRGEVVHTLMLSTHGPASMFNRPGMIEPKLGENLLLFLLPSTLTGVYASVTAPFDDDQAIFPLEHKHWTRGTYYKDGKEVTFREQDEKSRAIWDLSGENGEINREEVEHLKEKYEAEIAAKPPNDDIVHLKWKKETNANGWQRSIPDDENDGAGKTKAQDAPCPITHP